MAFPVDILTTVDYESLEQSSKDYMSKLLYRNTESPEYLQLSSSKKIEIGLCNVSFVPLHGTDVRHKILALFTLDDPFTAVGLYLQEKWWPVEEVLKTSDTSREGILEVRTVGERVVLYVLNRIVYRATEMSKNEVPFLCHSENDFAKILWKNGEAIGFYSVKPEGSLCSSFLTQRYQLPVLDSMFVRKCHRGNGHGLQILEDFVDSFKSDCLGIKYPLSPAMYKVCGKYLSTYPADIDLLWEVESVGSPFQRTQISSKILEMGLKHQEDVSHDVSMEEAMTKIQETVEYTVEVVEKVVQIDTHVHISKDVEDTPVTARSRSSQLRRKRLREESSEVMEETFSEKTIRVEKIKAGIDTPAEETVVEEHTKDEDDLVLGTGDVVSSELTQASDVTATVIDKDGYEVESSMELAEQLKDLPEQVSTVDVVKSASNVSASEETVTSKINDREEDVQEGKHSILQLPVEDVQRENEGEDGPQVVTTSKADVSDASQLTVVEDVKMTSERDEEEEDAMLDKESETLETVEDEEHKKEAGQGSVEELDSFLQQSETSAGPGDSGEAESAEEQEAVAEDTADPSAEKAEPAEEQMLEGKETDATDLDVDTSDVTESKDNLDDTANEETTESKDDADEKQTEIIQEDETPKEGNDTDLTPAIADGKGEDIDITDKQVSQDEMGTTTQESSDHEMGTDEAEESPIVEKRVLRRRTVASRETPRRKSQRGSKKTVAESTAAPSAEKVEPAGEPMEEAKETAEETSDDEAPQTSQRVLRGRTKAVEATPKRKYTRRSRKNVAQTDSQQTTEAEEEGDKGDDGQEVKADENVEIESETATIVEEKDTVDNQKLTETEVKTLTDTTETEGQVTADESAEDKNEIQLEKDLESEKTVEKDATDLDVDTSDVTESKDNLDDTANEETTESKDDAGEKQTEIIQEDETPKEENDTDLTPATGDDKGEDIDITDEQVSQDEMGTTTQESSDHEMAADETEESPIVEKRVLRRRTVASRETPRHKSQRGSKKTVAESTAAPSAEKVEPAEEPMEEAKETAEETSDDEAPQTSQRVLRGRTKAVEATPKRKYTRRSRKNVAQTDSQQTTEAEEEGDKGDDGQEVKADENIEMESETATIVEEKDTVEVDSHPTDAHEASEEKSAQDVSELESEVTQNASAEDKDESQSTIDQTVEKENKSDKIIDEDVLEVEEITEVKDDAQESTEQIKETEDNVEPEGEETMSEKSPAIVGGEETPKDEKSSEMQSDEDAAKETEPDSSTEHQIEDISTNTIPEAVGQDSQEKTVVEMSGEKTDVNEQTEEAVDVQEKEITENKVTTEEPPVAEEQTAETEEVKLQKATIVLVDLNKVAPQPELEAEDSDIALAIDDKDASGEGQTPQIEEDKSTSDDMDNTVPQSNKQDEEFEDSQASQDETEANKSSDHDMESDKPEESPTVEKRVLRGRTVASSETPRRKSQRGSKKAVEESTAAPSAEKAQPAEEPMEEGKETAEETSEDEAPQTSQRVLRGRTKAVKATPKRKSNRRSRRNVAQMEEESEKEDDETQQLKETIEEMEELPPSNEQSGESAMPKMADDTDVVEQDKGEQDESVNDEQSTQEDIGEQEEKDMVIQISSDEKDTEIADNETPEEDKMADASVKEQQIQEGDTETATESVDKDNADKGMMAEQQEIEEQGQSTEQLSDTPDKEDLPVTEEMETTADDVTIEEPSADNKQQVETDAGKLQKASVVLVDVTKVLPQPDTETEDEKGETGDVTPQTVEDMDNTVPQTDKQEEDVEQTDLQVCQDEAEEKESSDHDMGTDEAEETPTVEKRVLRYRTVASRETPRRQSQRVSKKAVAESTPAPSAEKTCPAEEQMEESNDSAKETSEDETPQRVLRGRTKAVKTTSKRKSTRRSRRSVRQNKTQESEEEPEEKNEPEELDVPTSVEHSKKQATEEVTSNEKQGGAEGLEEGDAEKQAMQEEDKVTEGEQSTENTDANEHVEELVNKEGISALEEEACTEQNSSEEFETLQLQKATVVLVDLKESCIQSGIILEIENTEGKVDEANLDEQEKPAVDEEAEVLSENTETKNDGDQAVLENVSSNLEGTSEMMASDELKTDANEKENQGTLEKIPIEEKEEEQEVMAEAEISAPEGDSEMAPISSDPEDDTTKTQKGRPKRKRRAAKSTRRQSKRVRKQEEEEPVEEEAEEEDIDVDKNKESDKPILEEPVSQEVEEEITEPIVDSTKESNQIQELPDNSELEQEQSTADTEAIGSVNEEKVDEEELPPVVETRVLRSKTIAVTSAPSESKGADDQEGTEKSTEAEDVQQEGQGDEKGNDDTTEEGQKMDDEPSSEKEDGLKAPELPSEARANEKENQEKLEKIPTEDKEEEQEVIVEAEISAPEGDSEMAPISSDPEDDTTKTQKGRPKRKRRAAKSTRRQSKRVRKQEEEEPVEEEAEEEDIDVDKNKESDKTILEEPVSQEVEEEITEPIVDSTKESNQIQELPDNSELEQEQSTADTEAIGSVNEEKVDEEELPPVVETRVLRSKTIAVTSAPSESKEADDQERTEESTEAEDVQQEGQRDEKGNDDTTEEGEKMDGEPSSEKEDGLKAPELPSEARAKLTLEDKVEEEEGVEQQTEAITVENSKTTVENDIKVVSETEMDEQTSDNTEKEESAGEDDSVDEEEEEEEEEDVLVLRGRSIIQTPKRHNKRAIQNENDQEAVKETPTHKITREKTAQGKKRAKVEVTPLRRSSRKTPSKFAF